MNEYAVIILRGDSTYHVEWFGTMNEAATRRRALLEMPERSPETGSFSVAAWVVYCPTALVSYGGNVLPIGGQS